MDLQRRDGQVVWRFAPVPDTHVALNAETQLEKLHRQLYHPSAENGFRKRVNPHDIDQDTRDILHEISRAKPVRLIPQLPFLLRLAFPLKTSSIRLSRWIYVLMRNGVVSRPVLHVIDVPTHL